jgi:hypothetical protein
VRKLTTDIVLAGGLVLAIAGPAAAQDVIYRFEQRGDGAGAAGEFFTLPVPPGGPGGLIQQRLGVLSVEPFDMAETVTNAPYSADIVTDVVQTLADGNRIEHHNSASVARDSQGRVRREQQLAAIGPILPQANTGRIVTIMNPVEGVHYSLDPMRKVAMRSPMPKGVQGGVARTQVIIGSAAVEGVAGRAATTDVDTIVTRRAPEQGRTEQLGTSTIEGVQAEGTRTVVTIPAGTIGNQAPIEMVTERWFSSELGVVVLSRRTDPRFGETTYRLQNIARGEPSPELFQVPSDYTVEALPAFGGADRVRPSIEP